MFTALTVGYPASVLYYWHQDRSGIPGCCLSSSEPLCVELEQIVRIKQHFLRRRPCWLSEMRMMSSLCIMGFLHQDQNRLGIRAVSPGSVYLTCEDSEVKLSQEPHSAPCKHIKNTSNSSVKRLLERKRVLSLNWTSDLNNVFTKDRKQLMTVLVANSGSRGFASVAMDLPAQQHLGKYLALAPLHFISTGWISLEWHSKDLGTE